MGILIPSLQPKFYQIFKTKKKETYESITSDSLLTSKTIKVGVLEVPRFDKKFCALFHYLFQEKKPH